MKKIMAFIIVFCFISVFSSFALDTKLIDYKFDATGFFDYDIYQDKIAFLSNETDYPGFFFKPIIIVFENGEWKKLPNYLGNDSTNILLPASHSQIHFDSTGNIWICGEQLYKFDGNQWTGYQIEGDTNNDKRRFLQFCVDKYNNIWITSAIRLDTIEYSEFNKFDGSKFTSIIKDAPNQRLYPYDDFMRSYILAAAPDGRVILKCLFLFFEKEFEQGQYKDIYIFNQDMTYQRMKLPTASGLKYDSYAKSLSSILPETDGKIWFLLGINKGTLDYKPTSPCCSGLTLFENDTWTVFNESNGLDTIYKDLYEPVYRITKLSNGSYFLIGKNMYYIMDSELKLKKYYWEDFFNKAEFIVADSYFNGVKGYEFLNNFLTYPPPAGQMTGIHSVFVKHNKIYIGMEKGLMIADESIVLSIQDTKEINGNLVLYPNPADDHINISSNQNFTSYQIVNTLGQVVGSGKFSNGSIPVSGIPSGVYFIKLFGFNQAFTITSFIKE
jgi:hypothetical protein